MNFSPEFIALRRDGSRLWIDSKLKGDPLVDLLWQPDRLLGDCECVFVKDQKKIKVARVPMLISGENRTVYVKRYNAFAMRHSVGSLFLPSGAVRSLRGAAILKKAAVETARPVAAIESRRWGRVTASFYLSEEIVGGKTADAYWRDHLAFPAGREGRRRRRRFVEKLALLFQTLHVRGVYHNDLKDANIIVAARGDAESIYLLDLEGVRQYRQLSYRRRVKNLVQLNRTLGRLLTRAERLFFLRFYLGALENGAVHRRRWTIRVLQGSRRRDRNAAARQPTP